MLVLVRDVPNQRVEQGFRDANDILSSFPNAKQDQREPTEREKKKRKTNSGGYIVKEDK